MSKLTLHTNGKTMSYEENSAKILVDGKEVLCNIQKGQPCSRIEFDSNKTYRYQINKVGETEFEVWIKHYRIVVNVQDEQSEMLSQIRQQAVGHQQIVVKSPMPGLVAAIEVQVGDEVAAGQGLLLLEAMKMENEIKSPIKGCVINIEVSKGDKVEKGARLVVIKEMG